MIPPSPSVGSTLQCIKRDHNGQEVWRYEGTVRDTSDAMVMIEAVFNRDDRDMGYVVFRRGDWLYEWFFRDRWYNIFELHDVDDQRIKGWYCNFTRPADWDEEQLWQDDLALDLFIYPDGRTLLLDLDEFAELPISVRDREEVEAARADLLAQVGARTAPFDRIKG
ncbi:MAG: DUF402 domain-containing protein [Chloroflexi bacterium]|nr:DUF402 domain-containing protein [Chloroflexota bacterium]